MGGSGQKAAGPSPRPARGGRRRTPLAALLLVVLAVILAAGPVARLVAQDLRSNPADGWHLRLRVEPAPTDVRWVFLETDGAGGHRFVLRSRGGREERLTPAEFAARLERDNRDKTLLYRLLNITSPAGIAWVALGLLGQVVFAGRMVLQWFMSERAGRSVVPVGFWWLSLAGASMLLTYFIWRRDIVGVLGQSTGWLIYVRNLWLIYRR